LDAVALSMKYLMKPHLVSLVLIVLIVGCTGASSGPDSLPSVGPGLDASLPEGITAWVVTTQGEGPRWIGGDWWGALGLQDDQLGYPHVRLEKAGKQVPTLWVEGPEGPGLLFYSKPITGSVQAYRLTLEEQGLEIGASPTSTSESSQAEACQTTTSATTYMESNDVYRSTAPLDEPWLWTSLRPPQEFSVTVPLTDAVEAPATMTLQIWGQSRMPVDPDHHLRVLWNGEHLDDRFWDGNNLEVWSLDLPDPVQIENTLTLSAPGETEAPVDMMWLDTLQFRWRRRLALPESGEWTSWTVESSPYACVEGLTEEGLVALMVDNQGQISHRVIDTSDETDEGVKIYQEGLTTGWLGVPWAAPQPVGIRPWAGIEVESSGVEQAEFIVMADASATEAVQPLLDAREAEGLTSLLLTPEAVYDSFGRGLAEVSAIREMIAFLHREGNLRYVLLIGDTTNDPDALPVRRPGELSIPTAWPRTAYVGKTASDSVIASDDEGQPLVALGRIPAADVQALRSVIEKTLSWQPNSRMLFVNDDEREFVVLLDQLAEISSPDRRVGTDVPDARQRVLDWLDAGSGTMVYSGHGSLPVLGDEKLLTWEDAGAWDGPTLVVAWSCLCASFAHPTHQSLAETWMLDREGAVAFVGPTGETTTGEQRAMALEFQRALIEVPRLGDAMLRAWHAAESDNVKAGFLLLGDPTLPPILDIERSDP
jgi:hypothetical protein